MLTMNYTLPSIQNEKKKSTSLLTVSIPTESIIGHWYWDYDWNSLDLSYKISNQFPNPTGFDTGIPPRTTIKS